MVECADDQWKWRAFLTASNIDQANNKLIICAIIFAAFAAALLGYLTVSFLMGKWVLMTKFVIIVLSEGR